MRMVNGHTAWASATLPMLMLALTATHPGHGLVHVSTGAAPAHHVSGVSPPTPILLPCITGWLTSCDSTTARFADRNATEMDTGWVQQPDGHVLLLVARPIPLATGPTGIWTSVLSSDGCSPTRTARGTDGALRCAWANPCRANDARCLPSVLLAFLNGTSGFGAPTYTVSPSSLC